MFLDLLAHPVYKAVFVDTWPSWVGGIAIGLFVVTFFVTSSRLVGVSSGFEDACSIVTRPEARSSWRLPFLGGLIAGGFASAALAGEWSLGMQMGMFDTVVGDGVLLKAGLFGAGGVLLGFGARLAGGCTSGHAIVGTALGSPGSFIATGGFMAAGFVVTNVMLRSFGA